MEEIKDNDYASFIFKEDLRRFKQHAEQTSLLAVNSIDTLDELKNYQTEIQDKLARYTQARQELRNRLRRQSEQPNQLQIKKQISDLTQEISRFRKEDKLCDAIAKESVEKAEKLKRYAQTELGKENAHDKFNGRSRADGKDIARRR
jgi:predicted nuclease with TOPRIM domain